MSGDTFNPPVDGVVLNGDAGNNILFGTNLNDQIFGLGGNDRLFGGGGMDLLEGDIGNDRLYGGNGKDKLDGGIGNDWLFGGNQSDWLFGGLGKDFLWGESGDDDLNGGEGNDQLNGGSGDDILDGGLGNDHIRLGSGSDIVVLAPGNGTDIVLDYKDGTDKIQLEGGITFDDLEFVSQGRRNTIIRIDKPGDPNDGENLAIFQRVRPNKFDITDFILPTSNTAPEITSSDTVSVPENQTSVIDVDSTDDNDSEGSGLTYSITGGDDSALFSINSSTGVVSFDAAPDFEAPGDANGDNDYELQVTVTDSGGLTDVQDITISVTDEVENAAPTITSPATASVSENQTSAIDVQSTDDVDSEGSGLTYSLTGGADQALFNLDSSTGVVTFAAAPDFEAPGDANNDNDYEIQVTVTDSAGLTDVQDITISVTDEVENAAPTITSPATASVEENQTSAIDVQSSDDVDSEGSGLTYSLTGGADQALFNLDSSSGVVTFAAAPDFEAPGDANNDNDYEIQVTVTDSGGLTDVQDITISVTDVADTNVDPVAVNQTYSTFGNTVLEVAGADIPGDEVTSVTSATSLLNGATDADGDTLSVQAGTFATTAGGSVTIFSDGSFYYTPEAGDTSVADTFTFTILDGNGGSDTATATINVSDDRIWYVDDDAAAGGDGTSANPFNSLASLNGAGGAGDVDSAGDRIYVLDGTYSSGFELEANQTFEGQGVNLVVDGTTLISGSGATSPTLSGSISGTNVGNATISGLTASTLNLTINSGTADIDVFNNTFNGASLNGLLDLNTSGSADVRIDVVGNTFNSGGSQSTGIEFLLEDSSQVDFNIIGNDIDVNMGNGVEFVATESPTLEGRVNNNTIDINSGAGDGILFITTVGGGINPNAILEIDGNTISGISGNSNGGITLRPGRGTLDATINNNTIDIAPTAVTGLFLESIVDGSAVMTINANNNDVDENGASNSAYAFVASGGTVLVEGFTGDLATTLTNKGNTVNGASVGAGNVASVVSGSGTAEQVDISQP